ncbi:MAG: flagellar basal body L-ring protein FlgH [Candidatus Gastranaerophilales bacterium]|nr:flagellar basal body L-ring protein FlgH [Candidatus Gastranaerophilales bacterium]
MIKAEKLVLILLFMAFTQANAESLFTLNASQSSVIEPKPLYASVRARNVGDIVSIVISETPTMGDNGSFTTAKSSSLAKNATKIFSILSKKDIASALDRATDGTLDVANSTNQQRTISMIDKIAAQVVQVLPNGNLLVQGKKTLIQQNERVDIIISGVVDPKWINQSGEINSTQVSNLQFAMSGNGSVSRGQNEGIVNKVVRTIF